MTGTYGTRRTVTGTRRCAHRRCRGYVDRIADVGDATSAALPAMDPELRHGGRMDRGRPVWLHTARCAARCARRSGAVGSISQRRRWNRSARCRCRRGSSGNGLHRAFTQCDSRSCDRAGRSAAGQDAAIIGHPANAGDARRTWRVVRGAHPAQVGWSALDESAIGAAKGSRFNPATFRCEAVAGTYQFSVVFGA